MRTILKFGGILSLILLLTSATLPSTTTTTPSFDVTFELVDSYGNVYAPGSTGLFGFYAYDQANGNYIYTDRYDPDWFYSLPQGTYTFGAFDGYFDGAGTSTVTLNSSLEGPDGFIVIQLSYWSE